MQIDYWEYWWVDISWKNVAEECKRRYLANCEFCEFATVYPEWVS